MSLEDIADRLYALPPEEFTAARTAEAKAADRALAKRVSALRKPTVGAWLVNVLARDQPELLDQLLALGPALAEAQRSGQGDALRLLGEQRRQLIDAVTSQAFEAAERTPTAALRSEVASTLEAALADPATADAVRTGRLTRGLSYAGFGGVDLEGAVAVARPAAPAAEPSAASTTKPDRTKDIAAAESRAQDAAGALDDAVRASQQTQQAQDEAEASEHQAAADVEAAEKVLHAAREKRTEAEQGARKARHRTEQAAKAVASAQARAEKARTALDKLRRA